jgi:membrane-bound lytic murein transglycosylase MltF
VRILTSVVAKKGVALFLILLAVAAACSRKPEELPFSEEDKDRSNVLISHVREQWNGDLGAILSHRRVIRVLVSYSKTNFAVVQGRPQGLEYELLHDYETFLGAKVGRDRIKPLVVFIAVPRTQLIPLLMEGRGDIAAGLTITPERATHVAFANPYITDIKEVVVMAEDVRGVHTLYDLSGRTVHVVAGSSNVGFLQKLNRQLREKGKRAVSVVEADNILEAEDVLEMVNSGIFRMTVVKEYVADLWEALLPDIVVRKDIVLAEGANFGWAVRKENPQLLASLNEFISSKARHGAMLSDILLSKYYGSTKWIRNPLARSEQQKLVRYQVYLKKYAKIYGFDWLRIAAMAYQESHLDRKVRSRAGAIGIMQMLPATARQVGIRNITSAADNIHAGVKYLALLRDSYFDDPAIASADKFDFALAAYNAGPDRIEALRRKAAELGLDPNKWFFNVERVALREIGWEPVEYVANIYKYYIAYKSAERIIGEKKLKRGEAR